MLAKLLRDKITNKIQFIGTIISKTHVSPNAISFFAIILAIVSAYFLSNKQYLLSAFFIFLTGLADALDGAVARASGKVSKFGNYFDAIADRLVEIIVYFGFAVSGYALEAFLALSGGLFLSYTKPRAALVVKIDNSDWPGIGDRADKIIVLVIGLLVANFYPVIFNFSTINWLLYLMAFIGYFGALQRIFYAKKIISK